MEERKKPQKEISFDEPISVSDYISFINALLSRVNIKVVGEVSETKKAASGHVYFSLKDEKTGDVINCAIWSSIYRMCGVKLEDGMKVILSGNADVYRARGTLTFKVKTVELAGEGALKKAYEELKAKLLKEGLFDEERKRKIPRYPEKIGVITSTKGAAVHDFINNLGKFGFKIFICDSRVEGQEAVEDLLKSMEVMKKKDLDVLVIVRGGGSLQSLMAFDNEVLVREIVNFPVPVIAGIGHHEDITLAALSADVSESTPTAVAGRLTEGFLKAKDAVLLYEGKIKGSFQNSLYEKKEEIYNKVEKVTHFFRFVLEKYKKGEREIKRVVLNSAYLIEIKEEKIKSISKSLFSSFKTALSDKKNQIERYNDIISINNPQRQLRLGYAIMKKKGKVVKSVKEVKRGEETETFLSDGKITSQIKNIKK